MFVFFHGNIYLFIINLKNYDHNNIQHRYKLGGARHFFIKFNLVSINIITIHKFKFYLVCYCHHVIQYNNNHMISGYVDIHL